MTNSTTIYSNQPFLSLQQIESNKVSYWLEKLFYQQKEINRQAYGNNIESESCSLEEKENLDWNQGGKVQNDRQTMENIMQKSNVILMSISSTFPFDIFPTTINVEATRITIITRQLFSSQVHSFDVDDIASVFIDTGLIFAAITLISKTYSQKKLQINKLWKVDAILLRRVIEGLRMFEKKEMNVSNYSTEELLSKLKVLIATKVVT